MPKTAYFLADTVIRFYGELMGYLYVIQAGDEDYYKIGVSSIDPSIDRIRQLQTGNHKPLSVKMFWITTAYTYVEKILHAGLNDYVTVGEWFHVPFSVIEEKIMLLKQVLGSNDHIPIPSDGVDADIELDESLDLEAKVRYLADQGLPASRIVKRLGFTSSTNYTKYKAIVDEILRTQQEG